MKKLIISGLSGFVGTNLNNYLNSFTEYSISSYLRNIESNQIISNEFDVIIHLAGKAHDTRNVSKPEEYYHANYELTKKIYDNFLKSNSKKFIFISSVKAVADQVENILNEYDIPNPLTYYGKSKLMAEEYIKNQILPANKFYYILRPAMIHGPGNKGNLNLLFKIVKKNVPWPLGSFENSRSFCSIENLCFIIKDLIDRADIPSGIYNVADDESISTNELIELIAKSQNKKPIIIKLPKNIIKYLAKIGGILKLPLNSERLQKLTENYIVSNDKIKKAIGKPLPVNAKDGLIKTFQSFNKDVQ
jgi:nucleoside-diphosphate-sugar epimerase